MVNMKEKTIQPVKDKPAVFIKDKKTLIIADLHIGIEEELKEYGIQSGSQTKKLLFEINQICKRYKPKNIFLLGDIKHNIPASTFQERRDVKGFLEKIKKFGKIHIIPGNHDGNIDKIIPKEIMLHPSSGIVIDNLGLVHGHRWPKEEVMRCEKIIMGHTHPSIMLTDRMNYKTYESCWVKGSFFADKLKEKYKIKKNPEVVIIPAFNPLCGGIAINKEGIVGPFGKIIDIKNCQIYLLDGTFLGKVNNI